MINAPQLLSDLIKLLKRLEGDLLQRIEEIPEIKDSLQAEWRAAHDARRCAETFETWVDQVITQAGVHWLLSCVFLRFVEDNQLVGRPWLGGTPESGRLALMRDRYEAYFQAHPLENDRDYLLAAFREAGTLPGLHTFFDEAHNPAFRLGISGDAAIALRQFWQQVDANTGVLVHDFTDPAWDTRFLGDLYQDLSEATRKRYALLQTPEFVEEFILDRTLTPAIREFGFRDVRMIDPTCGSGHFLLGGFQRLLAEWLRHEPGRNAVDIAQKALNAVAGVDLNPFAVAISRFRLFVAALRASGVQHLANSHDFKVSVAIGDSLLHGTRFGLTRSQDLFDVAESHADTGLAHAYASEDLSEVKRILGRQYHAVVGNPPYIVVKDAALNSAYRRQYASCHMKYSLGAPFTERFFELAISASDGRSAGYVGLITANSFMKREFGSKLIEQVLPRLDLTHVVDTSGAVLPGHGTDTVILFGRHCPPRDAVVRTVMGKKKEPSNPKDPAKGLVWSEIVGKIDEVGSESDFVSVADTPRATFAKHPWSIGGGGAANVKEALEGGADLKLKDVARDIGVFGMTNADEVMLASASAFARQGVEADAYRPLIVGDEVRDWSASTADNVLFPYTGAEVAPLGKSAGMARWLWTSRTVLGNRATFGKSTYFQEGRPWWAWHQVTLRRIVTPITITFSEIATHNHFVLDRSGAVYKQTAPVIKLPIGSSDEEHLGLLGLLNSSAVCFWLKQVCQRKGAHLAGNRTREERYAFNSSNVADIPITHNRPVDIAARLDAQSRQFAALQPSSLLMRVPRITRSDLDSTRDFRAQVRREMIATQEDLDWRCYRIYGLLPTNVESDAVEYNATVEVALGERAFEIVLARRVAAGLEHTTWFERHDSTPITEIPSHWPEDYRRVVAKRIELIEREKAINLIERPEFKRRWKTAAWQELERAALRDWLLTRLEAPALWPASAEQPAQISSTSRLAELVSSDVNFMQVAALYAGHADFDLPQLVATLVAAESVPALPVQRYTDTGMRKRTQWQATWALQRREDLIDAQVVADNAEDWRQEFAIDAQQRFGIEVGKPLDEEAHAWVELQLIAEIQRHQVERRATEIGRIPVPPKYQSTDFLKADFWDLRGGLDVPKERWISYPGCERGSDGSLVIAWAGWNHLQQAVALAGYYIEMKDSEGWEPARLQPLLASLLELVPWLQQWHNELDLVFGERMGDYYLGFVTEEARALGFTLEDLRAWKPAATIVKRGRKKVAT